MASYPHDAQINMRLPRPLVSAVDRIRRDQHDYKLDNCSRSDVVEYLCWHALARLRP